MFASVQIVLAVTLIAFLALWRRAQAKRKQHSWNDIISALCASDWGMQEVSERYLYRSGINATPSDIWNRIDGARGLRAMYKNAPLLIQVADYAAEHSGDPDIALLEELRNDAFRLRLFALSALAKNTLFRSNPAASQDAHSATALYSDILARVTTLLQESAGQLFPAFLEAM
jgi:hypothetical protein